MKNKKEIDVLELEDNFLKKVLNNAIICILAVILCFTVMCVAVNGKNGVCRINLDLFGYSKTMPVVVNNDYTAETGGIFLKVEGCEVDRENEILYINVSGRNNNEDEWKADGRTFAVAVQCMDDGSPREYYYNTMGDWEKVIVGSGENFSVRLGFHINDGQNMFNSGDIFSLMAFRGADCATSVIVLNGLIEE